MPLFPIQGVGGKRPEPQHRWQHLIAAQLGGKMSKTSVPWFPRKDLGLPLPTTQAGVCKHLRRHDLCCAGFPKELREAQHPHPTAVQWKASVQLFTRCLLLSHPSPTAFSSVGQISESWWERGRAVDWMSVVKMTLQHMCQQGCATLLPKACLQPKNWDRCMSPPAPSSVSGLRRQSACGALC